MRIDGNDKRERMDQVRRDPQQNLTFLQRFKDQREFKMLEVAQTAVDQARGGLGGAGAEVALFQQRDVHAALRGIAGYTCAVNSSADHDQIVSATIHPVLSACRHSHQASLSIVDIGRLGSSTSCPACWFVLKRKQGKNAKEQPWIGCCVHDV